MPVSASRQDRFAWLVVLFLFLGSVINYMDRTVLGVVMPQVRRDLSLTNAEYGLAVNAFLVLYMIFYVLGGIVADRLGCRRAFLVTISFWSVAAMLHVLARGLRSLCFFRALLGMGEGGYYPTAMRGAAEWFPPRDRAKAVGLILCGLSLGTLLTVPLVAWITIHHGWRASFLVTGALGFSLIPPWLWLHRKIRRAYGQADPAPVLESGETEDGASEAEISLPEALRRRKYWCVLTARALTDAAGYFYLFWMPGYFQEVRGYSLRMVGALLWIPYLAADVGALSGAWISSMLIRRGLSVDRSRKLILLPAALLGMVGGLAYFVAGPYTALAMISVALLRHQAWASNLHTVITEISPPKHVAVLYGITGSAGTLMGAITQPLIGRFVDLGGYGAPFVAASSVWVLAAGVLLAGGRIERMRRRPAERRPA